MALDEELDSNSENQKTIVRLRRSELCMIDLDYDDVLITHWSQEAGTLQLNWLWKGKQI